VNKSDGKVFNINLYDDTVASNAMGTLVNTSSKPLTDLRSLLLVNKNFYAVNNTGLSSIKNRLYSVPVSSVAGGGNIQMTEVKTVKDGNTVVQNISCLAKASDGTIYAISTDTNKLYKSDLATGALSYVMTLTDASTPAPSAPRRALWHRQFQHQRGAGGHRPGWPTHQ